jgi:site-specific DNA-methyltransferase (adenine-specific)/adenine-specific DNA-methyltransferase
MPILDWLGKQAVRNHHAQVPFHALASDPDLSVGNPQCANLLLQGDNLLALTALRPHFAGRVKCIYIDPPYNTGNETWAYNDAVDSPQIRSWLARILGPQADDLSRPDKWLCMMYPRLGVLRDFLTPDGVIFISIDDSELGHLLGLCDEVFGASQRLAVFTWVRKKKGSNLSKEFRKITEYVVAYKRSAAPVRLYGTPAYAQKQVPLLNRANALSTVRFGAGQLRTGRGIPDGLVRAGTFGKGELAVTLHNDVCVKDSVIVTPLSLAGRFRWSQATIEEELSQGSVFTASASFRINVSRYNQAHKTKAPASLLSPDDGIGTNEDASEELRSIFPELDRLPFEFPKPSSLVRYLVRSVCKDDKEAWVLDSFAGAGTTGHAVLALNQADGGQRRFILVEMDEAICQNVTAPRLARVIQGQPGLPALGGGFRYCRLGNWIFDPAGSIRPQITRADLAAHVYFAETGAILPLSPHDTSPLLAVHNGRAICLLFNGTWGDEANMLTAETLRSLPDSAVPRIVYGQGCRVDPFRLQSEGIIFKEIPCRLDVW